MTYLDEIKDAIGADVFAKLEKLVDDQVTRAIRFKLKNEYGDDVYFTQEISIGDLLEECLLFESKGLKISPLDVTNIIFKCKLVLEINDEKTYDRRNDGRSYPDEYSVLIPWNERTLGIDTLLVKYFERLKGFLKERTLLSSISHFKTNSSDPQAYFEQLFQKLNYKFVCFFNGPNLIILHKQYEPGLRVYEDKDARYFFQSPSLGFTCFGSEAYCMWYSITWLRSFFNILRIAGFIYPGQMTFGQQGVSLTAPTSPVFLGTHALGVLCWDEDQKESWKRVPDGCLFLSFGYRCLANINIDTRTHGGIDLVFMNYKKIFESIINPWTNKALNDIAPTLEILNSATQAPDLGTKILLVYCSLEHLFVPKDKNKNNREYIVGGINALNPKLLPWFDRIYKLRCAYAHKGTLIVDEKTRSVVVEAVKNIMDLLVAKLST